MIKFENCFTEDAVFARLEKYYEKKEYWSFVVFLNDKFELCSPFYKSKILSMLGAIYTEWQSYEQAVLALKYAIKFDSSNCNAYLNLAKVSKIMGDDNAFKSAFVNFANVSSDSESMYDSTEMINYFTSLSKIPQVNSSKISIVDDEFRQNTQLEVADELLYLGKFEEGIICLRDLLEKFPNFLPAYESLSYAYITTFDEERLKLLSKERLEKFPNDLGSIALYLFANKDNPQPEDDRLINKMFGMQINCMLELKKVCEVLELRGQYALCLAVIDNFLKQNDCANNYDILTMQMLAYWKINDKETARRLLKKLNIAYGMFGLGKLYEYIFDSDINCMKIVNYNFMPDEVWNIAETACRKIDECKRLGKSCSQEEYWRAFELLIMTCDEDTVIGFMLRHKDDFVIKNQSKIEAIVFARPLSSIVKAGILYALIRCGATQFTVFTTGGAQLEKFIPIIEFDDYPACYNDAYIYAFVYCVMNIEDFGENIHNSALELMKAMTDDRRNFRDEYALAGAIICNSYVIVCDEIEETIAKMLDCNAKRIKRYISIIQKNGEFFDLDDDDMFEVFIKRIASKIIDLDLIPE